MTKPLAKTPCLVCGGRLDEVLLVIDKPDRFEREIGIPAENYRREWVACGNCGAVGDVMRPEDAARLSRIADRYYEIDYGDRTLAERFDEIMALPPERSDNAERVHRIRSFARRFWGDAVPSPRAIDIGAGLGVFLAGLAKELLVAGEDWSLIALEPDPLASEHLNNVAMFDVLAESFPCNLPSDTYELITVNKVLEHFDSPVTLLEGLAQNLNPENGLLYIEVPDRSSIEFRSPDDNILGALHLHLHSIKSLLWLLGEVGLEPLRVERIVEPSGKISVYCFACPAGALATRAGKGKK